MSLQKSSHWLAQRLLIASAALLLAACASAPWRGQFSDPPATTALTAPLPVMAGFYRVNPGDTLASVAIGFGRDPEQIARFVWPASGPVISGFEPGQSRAIRIGGATGETIKAAGSGRVIYAGTQIKAYGLLVIIKHERNLVSAYGNNAKVLVKEGDAVKQGQPIAEIGAAGDPAPYLIFELRDGTKAVDPQGYLPKRAS